MRPLRTVLALLLTLAASPALADDFGDAPAAHPRKCKSPPCHCKDGTKQSGCVDKDACDTFCLDHDGPLASHKKRRKHHGGESASSDF